jgi:hypothetical protein
VIARHGAKLKSNREAAGKFKPGDADFIALSRIDFSFKKFERRIDEDFV